MHHIEEETSRVLCGSAARSDCQVPLACIGDAMKCHRSLQVSRPLSAVEDALSCNCDIVGVVDLVIHKISIDTTVERWAPVIYIAGFIFNGCWAKTAGVDNLNAAFNVRSMTPGNGLHSRN